MVPFETGVLRDSHPYLQVGSASNPVVVIPGVGDAMFSGQYTTVHGWVYRWYFTRYLDEHRVTVITARAAFQRDRR